jgi:hypothetical protein
MFPEEEPIKPFFHIISFAWISKADKLADILENRQKVSSKSRAQAR